MVDNYKNSETVAMESGDTQREHLGVAGNMARAFIHSPLSPLLLFACLAIGILGLIITPRQEDPQISVPMADIFVSHPGASAKEVASLVTDPLERIMSEIPGVKHVYSASMRGQSMVTVEFDVGEEMGESLVKLYDKLESNTDLIPPGVSAPLVKPKGVDDVPAVNITLWSDEVDDAALKLIGLDVLQQLKEIPNTSQSFVVGGRSEQIRIEAMPERLSGYGVTLQQLANTVRGANSETSVGSAEFSDQSFRVYSGSFLTSAEDVESLMIGVQDDAPVYVRDVARVFYGPEETSQMVNYYTGRAASKTGLAANGVPAVTLAIAKKIGSNGVSVADAVLAKVEELQGVIIPDNVQVSITRNYGKTANDKVNNLIFKLFVATGAVTLLVWLFLGWRPALVTLIVIPVVILVTVFSAWVLGYTIDRVSLFALIFSIGILVDDAIVVMENIYRRWLLKGETDTETSIDAVREVGNPTILATFTVVAALLPMGFVSGMMGPYMEPIPALGSVAMIFSLFAAFIFTPWLAMRFKPSLHALHRAEIKEHNQNAWIERIFAVLVVPIIKSRPLGWLFLIIVIVAFFASVSLFYTTGVTVKMMPYDNKSEFNVVIDMPEGSALPTTANLTAQLADILRSMDEVVAVQSYVGTSSPFDFNGMVRHYYLRKHPWQANIQVQLLEKGDRKRSSHQIALAARELVTPIAHQLGARLAVVEMPPGPPVLQSVVAEIYGPNAETLHQTAEEMTAIFEQAETLTDVDNYLQEPFTVWHFEVDTDKATRRGVSVDGINQQLSMAMGGYKVGDVKVSHALEPTYIVLQVPLEYRSDFSRLADLPIPMANGETIPLVELGSFVARMQDDVIYHKDLRPVEYVVADTVGRLAAPIYGMSEVERLMKEQGYKSADGITPEAHWLGAPDSTRHSAFTWAGEWTVTYETFRDMGIAFGVALILIYMLVVWEFGNFILPAIVMAPIPLTLIGIVPGHWLLGAEFTATSMIGFIALAGIIVRNSILLVDFSRQQVEQGVPVQQAVLNSAMTRTRPIIITALALVAGSSVILVDPIFQGMAISLMFGALVSTLLTLLVIPLGCISAGYAFCAVTIDPNGDPQRCCTSEPQPSPQPPEADTTSWLATLFYTIRGILILIWMLLYGLARGLWRNRQNEKPVNVDEVPSSPAPGSEHSTPVAEEVDATDRNGVVADSPPVAGEGEPIVDLDLAAEAVGAEVTAPAEVTIKSVSQPEYPNIEGGDTPTQEAMDADAVVVVADVIAEDDRSTKVDTLSTVTQESNEVTALAPVIIETEKTSVVRTTKTAKPTVSKPAVKKKRSPAKEGVTNKSVANKGGSTPGTRRGIRLKPDIDEE